VRVEASLSRLMSTATAATKRALDESHCSVSAISASEGRPFHPVVSAPSEAPPPYPLRAVTNSHPGKIFPTSERSLRRRRIAASAVQAAGVIVAA
jgi:hypothetical protein